MTHTPPKQLLRSRTNRILGGVAAGLGEYFGIDPTFIRIIFILLTFLHGSGILIYLILWLIIPEEPTAAQDPEQMVRDHLNEMKDKGEELGKKITDRVHGYQPHLWFGTLLIIFGTLFFLTNLGILTLVSIIHLWPLILIILGFALLVRRA